MQGLRERRRRSGTERRIDFGFICVCCLGFSLKRVEFVEYTVVFIGGQSCTGSLVNSGPQKIIVVHIPETNR